MPYKIAASAIYFILCLFLCNGIKAQLSKDTISHNKIRVSISYNFFPYTQKFMEYGLFELAKQFEPDSGKYNSTHLTRIPVGFSVVKSISKTVHFGGVINYQEYSGAVFNRNNKYIFAYKGRLVQTMVRVHWQFLTTKEVESYLGISAGFRNNKYILIKGNSYSEPIKENYFAGEIMLGFRVKLTNYLAIFSEFGLSNTPAKLGICLMNRPTNPFKNDSPYY